MPPDQTPARRKFYLLMVAFSTVVLSTCSTLSPARDLSGTWAGTATFTNNCANAACLYGGSVTLTLTQIGNAIAGVVSLDLDEVQTLIEGQGCRTLQGSGPIINGTVSSSRFTFTDSGGNSWSLNFTTDLIQGTVSNSAAGCGGLQSNNIRLSRQ